MDKTTDITVENPVTEKTHRFTINPRIVKIAAITAAVLTAGVIVIKVASKDEATDTVVIDA